MYVDVTVEVDVDEFLSGLDVQDAIDYYGVDTVLSNIDADYAIEFFDIDGPFSRDQARTLLEIMENVDSKATLKKRHMNDYNEIMRTLRGMT